MASIRQRGKRWQAEVRRKGALPQRKTFAKKGDATAWARRVEADLDAGKIQPSRSATLLTLGDALERYIRTRTAMKRHPEREARRARQLAATPLGAMRLSDVQPVHIAAYRDLRLDPPPETKLKPVSNGTVRLELALLSDLFNTAITEWAIGLPFNPVSLVKKPKPPPARDRRLREQPLLEPEASDSNTNLGDKAYATAARSRIEQRPQWAPWVERASGEERLLLEGAWGSGNQDLLPAILLAINTTLRQSTLLDMTWDQVDLENRTFTFLGKDGRSIATPIRRDSLAILSILRHTPGPDGRLFGTSSSAIRYAFHRLKSRLRLKDLRWHDLRHEGCSRLGDLGASAPQLAAVSQHKTLAMVSRYTHLGVRATIDAIDRLDDTN